MDGGVQLSVSGPVLSTIVSDEDPSISSSFRMAAPSSVRSKAAMTGPRFDAMSFPTHVLSLFS